MPQGDCLIMMVVGVGFIVLGLIGNIWGRHEERAYDEALSSRPDLREFISHWPERPQSGALKIGGWIAISVGFILLMVGIILWIISG